jgi:hypothetical protein
MLPVGKLLLTVEQPKLVLLLVAVLMAAELEFFDVPYTVCLPHCCSQHSRRSGVGTIG